MTEEKKVNIGINDGMEFFAHETSINFNPTQFILDFKCITPRVDPRNKEGPTLVLRHNVIIIDPYHAKKLQELLGSVVGKYEKEFGKIEKPKQLKKAEKKIKVQEEKPEVPHYLG